MHASKLYIVPEEGAWRKQLLLGKRHLSIHMFKQKLGLNMVVACSMHELMRRCMHASLLHDVPAVDAALGMG
jgi:hypothetical protein